MRYHSAMQYSPYGFIFSHPLYMKISDLQGAQHVLYQNGNDIGTLLTMFALPRDFNYYIATVLDGDIVKIYGMDSLALDEHATTCWPLSGNPTDDFVQSINI